MNASEELYQEIILDHSRHPRHYGCPLEHTHCAAGKNPLCGDEYDVYLSIDEEGIVREASFEGAGCAISKASASIMLEQLVGKRTDEVRELFEAFHAMITNPDKAQDPATLGKLAAFSGIWKYPSRVKCAILCWHAVRNALDGTAAATTEA